MRRCLVLCGTIFPLPLTTQITSPNARKTSLGLTKNRQWDTDTWQYGKYGIGPSENGRLGLDYDLPQAQSLNLYCFFLSLVPGSVFSRIAPCFQELPVSCGSYCILSSCRSLVLDKAAPFFFLLPRLGRQGANLLFAAVPVMFPCFHMIWQHPHFLRGYVPRLREMPELQWWQDWHMSFPCVHLRGSLLYN